MQCPICQVTLQMTDRQGVEIDYCPKCRGVWLDRGELQKIIDISLAQGNPNPSPAPNVPPADLYPRQYREHEHADRDPYRQDSHRHDSYRQDSYPPKHKKRESWLSDLFDWD